MTQSKMSAPEFTQAEIDTAWEDVLRQQASIIKSKEAEITALKDEREYAKKLQAALTSLVGSGGSECFIKHGDNFRADIDFCINRIRETRNSHLKIIVENTSQINALKTRYERICKRLGVALEANVDEAIAEHIALKAEIERLRNPWQPIETAPRDRWFLAFEDGAIYKAKFYSDDYDDGEIAYSADCGQPITLPPEPPHWCELPPVPQAQAAAIGEKPNE